MKRLVILSWLLIFSFAGYAQNKKYMRKGGQYSGNKTKYRSASGTLKNNPTDVFPLDRDFRLSGWYGALGMTYMYPMKKGEGDVSQTINDTTARYQFNSKPSGKIGPYLAIGYFHALQNPGLIHFWDVGISYRQYKGSEDFSGTTTYSTDSAGVLSQTYTTQKNNYTDQIISLEASVANHWHFSRYGFVQNAIGLNADYFFSTSRPAGPSPFPGYEQKFPEQFQVQLHYRIGVGWKATRTLLVIPSLTLPLITAYPFENGKSSLPYYATRQYPIIISIRLMLLRPLSEDCNVPNYEGPANFN